MSERDVLDEALAALREETAEETGERASSRASATRRALIVAATTRRRRRSLVARFVLPIAAVLAASTAWAAATGRLAGLFHVEREAVPPAEVRGEAAASSLGQGGSAPSAVASAAPEVPSAVASSASPPLPAASAVPAARASASASAVGRDPEETLYRAAHEAHFVAHDPARALAAWDAYLAAHPKGRFAPEARYNRALTLVRLGRTDDARAALRPFADGTLGGYRQKEATQLLDALE